MKRAIRLCLVFVCLLTGAAASDAQTDILLPDVTVIEPAQQSTKSESENVRVRALVRSHVPLVELRVMRDGTTLHKVKMDGTFHERSRYVLDVMITLKPGLNSISIIAENEKTSSKPETREIVYEPGSQSKPSLRVLAIGVSKLSGQRLSPKFATADAQAFVKAMSTQTVQGGLFASVDTKTLLDEEVTRQAVIGALKWLNGSAGSGNDVRVLFLSGSLATDYIDNSAYFLTSQFEPKADLALGNVSLMLFWQILNEENANTLIFANTDWAEGGGRYSLERFSQFGKAGSFHNYFASADGTTVPPEPGWSHSAFTTALLEGLDGKADLELPGGGKDGIIDTHELQTWVRWRVENLTGGKQLPAILVGQKRVPLFKLPNP